MHISSIGQFLKSRTLFEAVLVVAITLLFGLGIGFLGAIQPKFQLALAIGMIGLVMLMLVPQKRIFCLVAWILIQPLSIEKILYIAPGLWTDLRGQELMVNAGDLILLVLAGIVIIENLLKNKPILVWGKPAIWFLMILLWAVASYLMHVLFLQSPYVQSAPMGILHMVRNFLFAVIIISAIQTRADLLWVLLAVLLSLLLQSFLVTLSYITHEVFSFLRLLGQPTFAQTYTGSGEKITRAVGTLGIANQQGLYHTMFTFLFVGLFAVKKPLFRHAAVCGLLASFLAVILTFSRGSWLCIILTSTLISLIFIRRREVSPRAWLMGAGMLLVFTLGLSLVIQPVIDRLTKGDDGATDSRIRMMVLAKDLFLEHPIIGAGPGEYVEAGLSLYPPGYRAPEWVASGDKAIVPPLGRIELATMVLPTGKQILVPLSVHNKYLLTASELGLVGLGLWLMIFYQFFKDAKDCSQAKDPLYRYLGVAGMGLVLAASVYMNLDLFADDKTLQVLLFPLLVISATSRLRRKQEGLSY